MSNNRNYWLCQLSGWGIYLVVNCLILLLNNQRSLRIVISQIALVLVGLGCTHLLRALIHRRIWLQLSIAGLFLRLIAASVVVALVWQSITILMMVNIFKLYQLSDLKPAIVAFYAGNSMALIAIWSLCYFGIHLFCSYKQAEITQLKLQTALKDAELSVLKSQLNPHFMFNCLNSIRALIDEDPARAQDAVTKLSNILRYSLRSVEQQLVPFETEFQIIQDYLALESIRLEERLTLKFDIDPAATSIAVPPMLIQTLVENGIKHGIARRPQGGELSISAKFIAAALMLEIRNDGEFLPNGESERIGLQNTRERLKLLYGSRASFELETEIVGQVSARVKIPASLPTGVAG